MKNVYVRQYVAVYTTKPTVPSSFELAVVPFKLMPYAEFRTFFDNRAENVIGLEVVVEHFSTNLTACEPLSGDGKKYEHWRWYRQLNGVQNVWKCITEGKFYKRFVQIDGEFALLHEVK